MDPQPGVCTWPWEGLWQGLALLEVRLRLPTAIQSHANEAHWTRLQWESAALVRTHRTTYCIGLVALPTTLQPSPTCCSPSAVGSISLRWRLLSPATASERFKSYGGQYCCLTGGGDRIYGCVGGGETRWRTPPGSSRPSSHGEWCAVHFAPLSAVQQLV